MHSPYFVDSTRFAFNLLSTAHRVNHTSPVYTHSSSHHPLELSNGSSRYTDCRDASTWERQWGVHCSWQRASCPPGYSPDESISSPKFTNLGTGTGKTCGWSEVPARPLIISSYPFTRVCHSSVLRGLSPTLCSILQDRSKRLTFHPFLPPAFRSALTSLPAFYFSRMRLFSSSS
jgi:hypothetical protein